jgi:hypothetical protein
MLNRRSALLVKCAMVVVVAVAPFAVTPFAKADGPVYCPPNGGPCTVVVGTPGSPGDGDNGGGSTLPCDPDMGCLWPDDICYHKRAEPQPDATDPIWAGHIDPTGKPEGVVYVAACPWGNGRLGVPGWRFTLVWVAVEPATVNPAVLAAQAINQLGIRGPAIGIAPDPAGSGLVGLPVWLWAGVTPQTWGPVSATASVPGLSVTATAQAQRIVWDMGDGHSVRCDNPGTPYQASYGNTNSPSCGYRYTQTSHSQPGGHFTVTATTTWQVNWAGGGQSGSLTVTRASTTTVEINELQVVTS